MTNKNNFTRRNLLQTGAALGAVVAMPAIVGARRACAADTRTLKIIPEVDLKILDPIWTTATVTSTHGCSSTTPCSRWTASSKVHPADDREIRRHDDGLTWHFTLRDGLGWHDGTPVTAKDCVASIRRWAARFGLADI